jgi:hypothetical protein
MGGGVAEETGEHGNDGGDDESRWSVKGGRDEGLGSGFWVLVGPEGEWPGRLYTSRSGRVCNAKPEAGN